MLCTQCSHAWLLAGDVDIITSQPQLLIPCPTECAYHVLTTWNAKSQAAAERSTPEVVLCGGCASEDHTHGP